MNLSKRTSTRKIVYCQELPQVQTFYVGIDAIMNRKVLHGHYGLERYEMIDAYNRYWVTNEFRKARELNADVLLVSQTVTQRIFI